jgi:hypothetical protein
MGAFAVLMTRTDFYVAHNARAQVEVFYVAEAGLAHALADTAPAVTFDPLLDGPDGLSDTADDGIFPFREGPPGPFPHAPLRYEVRFERLSPGLLRLTSTGYGAHHALAVVEAIAAPDTAPHIPGALYAPTSANVSISSDFLISGFDHREGDSPDQPSGAAAAVPALAVDSEAAAAALRSGLAFSSTNRLVGRGDSPSIDAVASIDIPALVATLTSSPAAMAMSAGAEGTTVQLGTATVPQLTVLSDGVIDGHVEGIGVLVAPAGLQVRGSLSFVGLVLVLGDVVFDLDSNVHIDGTLWVGGSDPLLAFRGQGATTYDRDAVLAVDRNYPGHLPHALVVKSWRELL